MLIPQLSEASLRRHADAKVFERGEAYYRTGAVIELIRRGATLDAQVEGNEAEPYRVRLTFDEGGLTSTDCTCPFSFPGWCKHIVATLLVCLQEPETIQERPGLEQLLERLDLSQTRHLVQALAAEQPALIDVIDDHISRMTDSAPPSTPPARRTPVDPVPFRQEAILILRTAVQRWESGWDDDPIADNMQAPINNAREFTARGDSRSALVVLEAITDACADHWHEVDEYGAHSEEVIESLDKAWTEAILSTELTAPEKTDLQEKLQAWQRKLDGRFAISLEALRQGWDYPPLQQVLQGHITESGAWDKEAPDYADELALIRLSILERQGRHQEYLYLAEAEGQTEQYLTMLVHLGQVEAAMTAAETWLGSAQEAFTLAKVLREQGDPARALAIARRGLDLPGHFYIQHDLAIWASDLAEGLGDRTSALSARIAAFKARPSFGDYRKARELAAEEWPAVQAELLENLHNHSDWNSASAKVDIFLHEEMLDSAIEVASTLSSYQAELVKRVMAAAITQRPDWVIKNARRRAEEIIKAGKANAYHHAVGWLQEARAAYKASGRSAEWSAYRANLMKTHGRKHKLMGLLRQPDLS